MNQEFERAYYAEEKRHIDELVRLIQRWPEYRGQVCHALLGSAIATADTFGVDVEAFLAELRKREPRPTVLGPPFGRRS